MKTDDEIKSKLKEIEAHLDAIIEHMSWSILAEQRFHIGDKVEWSRKGREQGFPTRKKAQYGVVQGVHLFSVIVKPHGMKKPSSYHHVFFNRKDGPKLF